MIAKRDAFVALSAICLTVTAMSLAQSAASVMGSSVFESLKGTPI